MTLLIFFAVIFATIVLAIVLERIIHCSILVGFAFFSVALLVAVILGNTTLVIVAVIIGIIAFLSAFLDCIFRGSGFFRNNNCLRCDCNNDDEDNDSNNGRRRRRINNCNCSCNAQDDTLAIVNSNGRVIARISGNSIMCNNSCSCGNNSIFNENNTLGTTATTNDGIVVTSNSNCGCNSRYFRR